MSKRTNKLTLSHYITYLTGRTNRYSYYTIASSSSSATTLIALAFFLYGLRLNLFSTYTGLQDTEIAKSVLNQLSEASGQLQTIETILGNLGVFCFGLFLALVAISVYENHKLEKFMRQDGPIDLEELRKHFKITRKHKGFKFRR